MIKRFSIIASVFMAMVFVMVGATSAPASVANYHMPLLIDFDVDDAHGAPYQAESYDFTLTLVHGERSDISPEPKNTFETLIAQDVLLPIGGDAFRVDRG